jgi:hypothetical protein
MFLDIYLQILPSSSEKIMDSWSGLSDSAFFHVKLALNIFTLLFLAIFFLPLS